MRCDDHFRAALHNQRLSSAGLKEAVDVVRWFGAVQAQDYGAAKWALALRMQSATDAAIEHAYNEGQIIRTHLMRPTWHFVAPEDIRWLLALTAPQRECPAWPKLSQVRARRRGLQEDEQRFDQRVERREARTRAELRAALNRSGVAADDLIRLAHIMMRAELDGVVCSGRRVGKQFTYALLEERVATAETLPRDEALAKLSERYFTSHGPATLQDFVWWSGLTASDARRGVEMIDSQLRTELVADKSTGSTRQDFLALVARFSIYCRPSMNTTSPTRIAQRSLISTAKSRNCPRGTCSVQP